MRFYILVLSMLACAIFPVIAFSENTAGGEFRYESRGKRDPFVPLIGIDRPAISKLEEITSPADIRLEGIASGAGGRLVAMLNGEIVKEGQRFGEIEIQKITKESVTIGMSRSVYTKVLGEEGGKKIGK